MIKTILKSSIKSKLISIFLIVEFTITIFLSLEAIETYEIINSKRKMINKMFDVKNTLIVRAKDSTDFDDPRNFIDIIDNIKSIDGVKKVGYYYVMDTGNNVKDNLGNIKKYVYVNDDMLDIIHVKDNDNKTILGNVFSKDDNQNEINPIVTGSSINTNGKNFDISCSLGLFKKTYKSIATVKEGSVFLNNDYIGSVPVNLNESVILKIPNIPIKSNALEHYSFIKINSKDPKKLIGTIYERFNKKGINVTVATVEDNLNEYIKENEAFFIAKLRITVCLVIFAILGTAVTMILSVNRKRREFGIRMSSGASKFYLLRLVYGEIIMLILISYGLALAFYSTRNRTLLYTLGLKVYELFNPIFSIKYLLCVFALLFLVSFTVIKTILKMNPRELIGGAK